MFRAALWSGCRRVPHSGHSCHRTDKPFWTRTPQPEQACEVEAGGTATPLRPAHAALKARMLKHWDQPASEIDLARWWCLSILAVRTASCESVSFSHPSQRAVL